jgi:Rrf2 family protein
MKISTRTRYGLRMMLEIALNYGGRPVLLRQIARNQGISEKYLGQLVIPLKAGELLVSERGAKGGYRLTKPPAKIKLSEIVEALEGPVNIVECVGDSASCRRSAQCVTRGLWQKLNRQISETLAGLTLADLVRKQISNRKKIKYYEI